MMENGRAVYPQITQIYADLGWRGFDLRESAASADDFRPFPGLRANAGITGIDGCA